MATEPSRLPGLAIGPIQLDFPVVQAALSGYSDGAMRIVAKQLGAPYTICEVMLDRLLIDLRRPSANRRALYVTDQQHPVGGQLMGADPVAFGPAAMRLVEAGFDVIDINFGCPVKKVLGRCRGGFHLGQPAVALEIVARVRDSLPETVPVTVKMRRGIDDSEASRENFLAIFDGAFQRGVAAITVHARTVQQRYEGAADWGFLRDLKQYAPTRTILGSGDLFSAQACIDMLRTTGVDGVAVARGAIGNPWIFAQARALAAGQPLPPPPTVHQQRRVIAQHYGIAETIYGPRRCIAPMRKFGIKYARLHPQPKMVRDAFVAVKEAGQWRDVLATWYARDLPGQYPEMDEST